MTELPYMRLWVGDLMADVMENGWTEEEFGAYVRLLCVSWRRGSIPATNADRARFVACTPVKLAKLWPAFSHKWESDGNGGLVNPRQERERGEARKKSEAGVKAATARWGDKR